jgi:hypothetical protein
VSPDSNNDFGGKAAVFSTAARVITLSGPGIWTLADTFIGRLQAEFAGPLCRLLFRLD